MTKRALTVGERVSWIEVPHWKATTTIRKIGTICEIQGETAQVYWGNPVSETNGESTVALRDLRRLKPKPQKERGERLVRWMLTTEGLRELLFATRDEMESRAKRIEGNVGYTRLLAVSESEIPISRETLAAAWDLIVVGMARADHSPNSASFDKLCEKLGFVTPKKGLP